MTNLRWVTYSQNAQNAKMHKDNKAGTKGVRFREDIKKWSAQICINGKQVHLGCFMKKKMQLTSEYKGQKMNLEPLLTPVK